jgi:hypothetical protein
MTLRQILQKSGQHLPFLGFSFLAKAERNARLVKASNTNNLLREELRAKQDFIFSNLNFKNKVIGLFAVFINIVFYIMIQMFKQN